MQTLIKYVPIVRMAERKLKKDMSSIRPRSYGTVKFRKFHVALVLSRASVNYLEPRLNPPDLHKFLSPKSSFHFTHLLIFGSKHMDC